MLQRKTPLKAGKPAKFRSNKPARPKAVKSYMSRVAELGCVVCRNLGFGASPAELHHPRYLAGAGQKAGDEDVIPLCPMHHRIGGYGIAYHAGPEEWERRYGTESELLAQTKRETNRGKE